MQFSVQFLLLLTTAFALVCFFFGKPTLAFGSMCFVFPFAIVGVGLLSPQKGTSLDVGGNKIFMQLFKLWGLLIAGLIVTVLVTSLIRGL